MKQGKRTTFFFRENFKVMELFALFNFYPFSQSCITAFFEETKFVGIRRKLNFETKFSGINSLDICFSLRLSGSFSTQKTIPNQISYAFILYFNKIRVSDPADETEVM